MCVYEGGGGWSCQTRISSFFQKKNSSVLRGDFFLLVLCEKGKFEEETNQQRCTLEPAGTPRVFVFLSSCLCVSLFFLYTDWCLPGGLDKVCSLERMCPLNRMSSLDTECVYQGGYY